MKSSPIMLNFDYGKVPQVPFPLDFSLCNLELPSMLHFTKLPSAMALVFTKQQNPFAVTGCVTHSAETLLETVCSLILKTQT